MAKRQNAAEIGKMYYIARVGKFSDVAEKMSPALKEYLINKIDVLGEEQFHLTKERLVKDFIEPPKVKKVKNIPNEKN